MTGAESLLCSLLECGTCDLSILDDVGYDLGEIAEDLQSSGIKPTLNAITDEIFTKGQRELKEALDDKISELESGCKLVLQLPRYIGVFCEQ